MKTLIYFCFSLILFVSCIEKRITRLDQKAVRRVKADIRLLDDVFYAGLKLHPCDNDTLYLPPKIDNVGVISSDTIRPKRKPGNCIPDTVKIETEKRFRDSIPYKVIDTQKIDILTDSLNAKNKQLAFKDGQLLEKDKQNKEQKKKEIYLWLTISGLICSIGIGIYLKLRKII